MSLGHMSFGQMIKLCRKEKGFTQSELAELIGVSMQAVSKWETDTGMPDISQIVPLAKVLEVSSDKLLGLSEHEASEELANLRKQIGHHTISFGCNEAQRIYDLAVPYFSTHPTNSEVAFWCVESLAELIAFDNEKAKQPQILMECERYANCIFRYEADADQICKTYYVMSRVYNLLGESKKSADMLDRLPVVFGDRTYWEAEFAFADRNMPLALQKCKESFAAKARFISRCIRLARMISEIEGGEDALQYQAELNEYMLNIINAFLSCGDYMPYRQIYQKASLLCHMTWQYSELGNAEKAVNCTRQLIETKNRFFDCLDNPENKHCLMFIEGDRDGDWHATRESIESYVSTAINNLKSIPQFSNETALYEALNMK
ncbi:MAG: helix-turn-helix transcriptional regulator [Oscillospiraceae bacterium]|nr:helix-turn-helix transcriptional regulator [Oscillospiraceae bacterium]